jgi:hypothetical protein
VNPMRVLRWVSGAVTVAGLLLGLVAMTASPWLRLTNAGQAYGIRFALVEDLVRVGRQTGSTFPSATNLYFSVVAWVLLAVLTLGAALSGLRLPRTELIAGITAAACVAATAFLLAACRPLTGSRSGISASSGPWLVGGSYLLLGAAAVLGAVSGSGEPRRSVF